LVTPSEDVAVIGIFANSSPPETTVPVTFPAAIVIRPTLEVNVAPVDAVTLPPETVK
jgi:hypothetical protein